MIMGRVCKAQCAELSCFYVQALQRGRRAPKMIHGAQALRADTHAIS